MGSRKKPNTDNYLAGRILMAMPGLGDTRFHKAVIFLCAHDEKGAMGLVINHVMPGVALKELLTQLNIKPSSPDNQILSLPVMSGGPVEPARGFVLHTPDFQQMETITINESFCVTGTLEALKEIATGKGPYKMLFVLGYAGWSAGQLDKEIQQNAWLIADADPDLIFKPTHEEKWNAAIRTLGFDPHLLSGDAGHA